MKAIYGIGVAALALLVLVGAAAIASANLAPGPPDIYPSTPTGVYPMPQQSPAFTEAPYIIPPKPSYSVQTMQGFVMDTDALETEPVVFVRISYGSRETSYLFIGEELHKLRQLNRQWVENGEVVKYSVEGMDERLTLYSRDGFYSSASGLLGDRMLVFAPQYYAYPVRAEPMNMTQSGGQPVDGVVCGSAENQVIGPDGITCKGD